MNVFLDSVIHHCGKYEHSKIELIQMAQIYFAFDMPDEVRNRNNFFRHPKE